MSNLERALFWILLAVVALAPLPLSSFAPWAWSLIGTIVGILLVLWAAAVAIGLAPYRVPLRRVAVPAILFGLTVAWALVQTAPFTPTTWHYPLWHDAAALLHAPVAGSIAVDRYEAASATLRLVAYGGVFWLSLQLCRRREASRLALAGLVVAGAAYAVYGLAAEFSGTDTILWYPKEAFIGSLTSTFVNRNAYAAYAGIGLICTTALLAHRIIRARATMLGPQYERTDRLRLYLRELIERSWYLLLAWIVIATALIMSLSRGGLAATAFGLVVFFIAIGLSPSIPGRLSRILAIVVVVAGIGFFQFSGGAVVQRMAGFVENDLKRRLAVYELTLEAISDTPVLGTGYGSFPLVFHLYRTDSSDFHVRFARVHDTYLENALELGIPAALCLFGAIGSLGVICVLGVRRRRRDAIYPTIGAAVTVLVAAHATIDFSLQIPAVAVTYAMLMGLACAQAWGSEDRAGSDASPLSSAAGGATPPRANGARRRRARPARAPE